MSNNTKLQADVGRRQRGERTKARSELRDLLPPRKKPLSLWWRAVYFGGAVFFVVCGMVGWLVPVVTGIPFYVAAIVLAGLASERVRGWVNRVERKLPHRVRVRLRRVHEYLRVRMSRGRTRRGGASDDHSECVE